MMDIGLSIGGAILGAMADWRVKVVALGVLLGVIAGAALGVISREVVERVALAVLAFVLANAAKEEYRRRRALG